MKRYLHALPYLLGLMTVGLSSCDWFHGEREVTWSHYASGFLLRPDMEVSLFTENGDSSCLLIEARDLKRAVRDPLNIYGEDDEEVLTMGDNDPYQQEKIEELVRRFGEAEHETKKYWGFTKPHFTLDLPQRYFLANPIDGITIKSSIDWGAEYPAGSSLDGEFWVLGRCHDLYAKKLIKPTPESKPSDFLMKSEVFMNRVKNTYLRQHRNDYEDYFTIVLSKLSEADFSGMDYLEPSFFVTSDNAHLLLPQTLTITMIHRDGSHRSAKLVLPQERYRRAD